MSDLYNGIHEYNSNDIGGLILPTSFEDALSYDQQILWLYLYKQALLQAGENIELHENTDGTVTISSTGGGATYTIRSTTPDSGFGSAYELVNVDTGERAGSKINIPEAIDGVGITSIVFKETDPQGNNVYTVNLTDGSHYDIVCPRGLQGVAGRDGVDGQDGQDGTNGTDGVGITSITFKETDAQGNNIYTVNLTNSTSYDITCPKGPQGATGPAGAGVATGGTTGQVLSKTSNTDYDTQWRDVHEVPSGGTAGQVLSKVDGTDYNVQWGTPSGGGDEFKIYGGNNIYVWQCNLSSDRSWGDSTGTATGATFTRLRVRASKNSLPYPLIEVLDMPTARIAIPTTYTSQLTTIYLRVNQSGLSIPSDKYAPYYMITNPIPVFVTDASSLTSATVFVPAIMTFSVWDTAGYNYPIQCVIQLQQPMTVSGLQYIYIAERV